MKDKNKLFAYQEKVWIFVDPISLNNPNELPIFEGAIESITTEIVSEHGRQTSVKYSYTIDIGALDNLVHRCGDKVFESESEAAAYAIDKMQEQANNAKNLLKAYEKSILGLKLVLYPDLKWLMELKTHRGQQ